MRIHSSDRVLFVTAGTETHQEVINVGDVHILAEEKQRTSS